MDHIMSYKVFEYSEVKEKPTTFKTYFDKMSVEDRMKSDALLEKDPRHWTKEEHDFMKRMSRKNIKLYIGDDNVIYTAQELHDMGIDVEDKKIYATKHKNVDFLPDVKELVGVYKSALRKSKDLSRKHEEEYDFTKIVNPMNNSIEMAIYNLEKLL